MFEKSLATPIKKLLTTTLVLVGFFVGIFIGFDFLFGFTVSRPSSISSVFVCKNSNCKRAYSIEHSLGGRSSVKLLSNKDSQDFNALIVPNSPISSNGIYRANYDPLCKEMIHSGEKLEVSLGKYRGIFPSGETQVSNATVETKEASCGIYLYRLSSSSSFFEWFSGYLVAKYASWYQLKL